MYKQKKSHTPVWGESVVACMHAATAEAEAAALCKSRRLFDIDEYHQSAEAAAATPFLGSAQVGVYICIIR
jgi:hypothetical protein